MSSSKSKYQRSEPELIQRTQIKNAEYNPRGISKEARKRLKDMLAKHGLVSSPVWNKRTGNLVSGHQRLNILDELEKGQDYALSVDVIDVDPAEEKKLNIQLNNPSMQGDWDMDKLTGLIEDDGLNPYDLGFNQADVSIMFGDDSGFEDAPEVTEAKDSLRKIKEHRAEATKKMEENQSGNFYFTVVCESEEQKAALLRKLQCPQYEQFVNGCVLAAEMGV